MFLRRLSAPLLIVAGLVCLPTSVVAQSPVQEERIAASFVLALGRKPSPDEIQRWGTKDPTPLADYLERHRRQLRDDPAAERTVIVKASQDAFGRAPTEDEAKGLSGGAGIYLDLMRRHLQWLPGHPAEYVQVMHRYTRDSWSVLGPNYSD